MQRFRQVLLDVWREAGRHIEIDESVLGIAPLLSGHLPLARLLIRRGDEDSHSVCTVAAAPADGQSAAEDRRVLHPGDFSRLRRWCEGDRLLRRGKRLTGTLGLVLPPELAGDVIAVPLGAKEGACGCLLAIAAPEEEFEEEHFDMLAALREPFSVTFENDRRLHELASLREAAEAERGTLLRRLGRTDLGDTIVGEHTGLKQVMERVDLVAHSDVPVLILGETGTGKELVARALHVRGSRNAGPFMRVNCGAIPGELIDSQLFGHEKGSFTGAEDSRQGWFERADGGTLFLDEIGELPLDAQVRFLRVLQDGFVERVGGSHPIHVDVRVIAATHRDLAMMVREGRFREDLWYRLAVFPVLIPPLRERRADIRALAEHFADRAAARFTLLPARPSDEDIRLLQSYEWPGNIRELGAVIDRAAILGNGQRLEIAKSLGISGSGSGGTPTHASAAVVPSRMVAGTSDMDLSLDGAMRAHIERVLELTEGQVEGRRGAAALLKINPHTLRARMRKLKVDWARFRPSDS